MRREAERAGSVGRSRKKRVREFMADFSLLFSPSHDYRSFISIPSGERKEEREGGENEVGFVVDRSIARTKDLFFFVMCFFFSREFLFSFLT